MLIEKNDIPIVAMDFMNSVHFEDVEIINSLFELILRCENVFSDENILAIDEAFTQWIVHTKEHFRGEEIKMEEMRFAPYPFHKMEHDNALGLMDEIFKEWRQSRDIMVLKVYFIEELPQWFTQHIAGMDTVTAMFFKIGISPCSMR
ncbi:MAG: hypothetical protein KN64_12335 [Sulfurovum sp. AS07-7]|nr:MAG: hypothetical protein KN64_12335 [Sulfurovum sp. AS07-7]